MVKKAFILSVALTIALTIVPVSILLCKYFEYKGKKDLSIASMIFYVSPGGWDEWSGMLPEPNEDKTDGPFATIARAQNAIRELKKKGG